MTTTELTGAEDVAWNLSDLYESGDDPRLESDVDEAESAAAAFRNRYHGEVAGLDAAALVAAIEERERIESVFTRAIYYAHLWFATDMTDSQRGALVAHPTEKGAAGAPRPPRTEAGPPVETQLLFFSLELADLGDEAAEALLADAALERWQHWLRPARQYRPAPPLAA